MSHWGFIPFLDLIGGMTQKKRNPWVQWQTQLHLLSGRFTGILGYVQIPAWICSWPISTDCFFVGENLSCFEEWTIWSINIPEKFGKVFYFQHPFGTVRNILWFTSKHKVHRRNRTGNLKPFNNSTKTASRILSVFTSFYWSNGAPLHRANAPWGVAGPGAGVGNSVAVGPHGAAR